MSSTMPVTALERGVRTMVTEGVSIQPSRCALTMPISPDGSSAAASFG